MAVHRKGWLVAVAVLGALALAGIVGGQALAATTPAPGTAVYSGNPPQPQGQQERPWLGIVIANVNERIKERLGLTTSEGVVILRVLPGSPAEKGGLKARDVILAVGGVSVKGVGEIRVESGKAQVGEVLSLTIRRGDQQLTVEVTVGTAPERPQLRRVPFWGYFGWFSPGFGHFPGLLPFWRWEGIKHTLTVTVGSVAAVTEQSLTISPRDEAATKSYQVSSATRVWSGPRRGSITDLKPGDTVLVLSGDGGEEARLVIQMPHLPRLRWRTHQDGSSALRSLSKGLEKAL